MPKRILIVAATTGYQTRVFEDTARRLGFDVTLATDRCHVLEDPWGDHALAVRFHAPAMGAETLSRLNPPPDGIVAVADKPTEIASLTAERLGLPFHSHSAVLTCRNKFLMRECLRKAGLNVPEYFRVPLHIDIAEAARCAHYPCVLKPLGLSASRGVIRADDEFDFIQSFERIRAILEHRDIAGLQEEQNEYVQVESYIPGREFALEGLAIEGNLKVLAIFDKPDPLEGPFFEETIYVTPSRESADVQRALIDTTRQAVAAVGLTNGPVHAEMRYNDSGVWMLEVAARPIGGLCAAALRFGDGMSLEELLIRFSAGEDVSSLQRESAGSGVMMVPIPSNGVYRDVAGIDEARAVPCVTDVIVTAKPGQRLQKLPEAASYMGFIFARAEGPEAVETALRLSHSRLTFEIQTELPALNPS